MYKIKNKYVSCKILYEVLQSNSKTSIQKFL